MSVAHCCAVQLHMQQAKIYVQAPHTESASVLALNERLHKVELESKDLKERMGKLESAEQHLDKIALRRLLHMSRHKLAGGELTADQRSTLNTRIQAGLVTAPPGVSVKAVHFTKFGPGSGQEVSNMTACDFSAASIAEAVMSQPVHKRVL